MFALLERLPPRLARLTPRLRESWRSLQILCSLRSLLAPTLLSIASWSLEALSLWVILIGLGTDPGVSVSVFVYATSTLAGALIPVPGGLGITEGSLEQQLTHLGHVPLAAATSGMLLIRIATLWYAVLLGFLALGMLRRKFPRLLSESAEPEAAIPVDLPAAAIHPSSLSPEHNELA